MGINIDKMLPKRSNVSEEELEDIKKSPNFMSEEITISKQQKPILNLIEDKMSKRTRRLLCWKDNCQIWNDNQKQMM